MTDDKPTAGVPYKIQGQGTVTPPKARETDNEPPEGGEE